MSRVKPLTIYQIAIGLRKEEPRAGKRKPIEESDDEEDAKKVGYQLE